MQFYTNHVIIIYSSKRDSIMVEYLLFTVNTSMRGCNPCMYLSAQASAQHFLPCPLNGSSPSLPYVRSAFYPYCFTCSLTHLKAIMMRTIVCLQVCPCSHGAQ